MQHTTHPQQRQLAWDGCGNVRDLGGLPSADGSVTRWSSLIRADFLNKLSDAGRQALLDYGVRTIIDLRAAHEAQADPSVFAAPTAHPSMPAYLNLPIEYYYPHVSALISKAASRADVYCIILDQYPDAVAAIMRAIASAQPGGVVIHCHAGNDRTGIVAALLLRLAGVPADAIAEDYAASQLRPASRDEPPESAAADDFWCRPTVTVAMMHTLLTQLAVRHGGVRAYLAAAGISDAETERLRGRLRTDQH